MLRKEFCVFSTNALSKVDGTFPDPLEDVPPAVWLMIVSNFLLIEEKSVLDIDPPELEDPDIIDS